MIDLTAEYIFVCLTILLSTLFLYGFWKLINEALLGDQEIMALLNRVRAMKAQTDQQSLQVIAEIAGLAVQTHRMRRGEKREDEPAGSREDAGKYRVPCHIRLHNPNR